MPKRNLCRTSVLPIEGFLTNMSFMRQVQQEEPDINNIFTLWDTHNIPLATNLATAELLILALDRGDLDWREFYK